MIPVWLLWRVRLRTSQKLGLAAFLCLSFFMVIIAIVRVSGLRYRGKFDNPWIFMWQQVEACVAVTMLSLTAFRSVFVVSPSNANDNKASPWVPSTRRLLGRHKKSKTGGHELLNDVSIPSGTITGLNRVFHRNDRSYSLDNLVHSGIDSDEYKSPAYT